jgi:hypothetical protein
MTMTHFPGPWSVYADGSGATVKAIDHGKALIVARVASKKFTAEGNQANARLIAAAPDLLAALRVALADLQAFSDDNDGAYGKSIEIGLDALAKAGA